MCDNSRLEREKRFHDKRFGQGQDPRQKVRKYYSVNRHLEAYFTETVAQQCRGKPLLEYGCGRGERSIRWIDLGAEVTGIDISPQAIKKAVDRAEGRGYSAKYLVMDAENTTFDDESFEVVVGTGIIHHLDLASCYGELARITTKKGCVVFSEPLGSNPLIGLFRALTPKLRTEDEHPLQQRDLKLLENYFMEVELKYFSFFTLLAVPFRKLGIFDPLHKALAWFDDALFRIPGMNSLAWMVVIHAAVPRKIS